VTAPGIDFIPTGDVLFRDPTLAYIVELPVLGLPTRFETNSRSVGEMIAETFAPWRHVGAEGVGHMAKEPPLRVRIVVHEGTEHGDGRSSVRHICPDATRLIAHSPGSVAVSDPLRRDAIAFVTTALVADEIQFRGQIVEAMTLSLLSHFDRHPLHAAAVAGRVGARAVILAAPSGTGKSTLAYLAHRSGLHVLSEDRIWIQRSPTLRVWGWPGRIHLRPEAPARFAELAKVSPSPHAGGKPRLAVEMSSGAHAPVCFADDFVLCVVERGSDAAALTRAAPETLATMLHAQVPPGFDRFPERIDATIHALTRREGWRLRLSDDPHDALPLLMRIVEES
jgi:hypothetical protein